MVTVRLERRSDVPAVRGINELAFALQTPHEQELGTPAEAGIVDAIRSACPDAVSMVAVDDDQVVGHIFFSPVNIHTADGIVEGMGLAPMAVLPERQRQGIGSKLVEAGLEEMRTIGCPFVIVLGHPEYYPRFGFVPASRHGLSCQWDGVPDEAFMVLILDKQATSKVSGVARYRDEFDQAM